MRNIIKKILNEEFNEFGFDTNGFPLFTEIDPATEFIYNKFMECKLIGSKKTPGWTKYIDKKGKILFLDNIETGKKETVLYFDHHEIYQKLKEMGLNYEEIKKLCIDMLYETHKRKVSTAWGSSRSIDVERVLGRINYR
jgi:hypothetical protein